MNAPCFLQAGSPAAWSPYESLLGLALPEGVPGSVEVFAFNDAAAWHLPDEALACLSTDELARQARYRHPADAWRYANARCMLRHLLGERLDLNPQDLRFSYGKAGKPVLADAPQWHFNISHSADVTLLALSREHVLGVDIEAHDQKHPTDAVACHAFTPEEQAHMAAAGFYTLWTAKEAALKAWGCGLGTTDLQRLGLLPRVDAEFEVVYRGLPPAPLRVWRLQLLAGYSAALAISESSAQRCPAIDA